MGKKEYILYIFSYYLYRMEKWKSIAISDGIKYDENTDYERLVAFYDNDKY